MVNNIMAAVKTAGSTKAAQSQSSKKPVADDRSIFTQALSNAASVANSTDNQTVNKKSYDKKDTSDAKDSVEAVQETSDDQEALSTENVTGQEAFVSMMQMGADNSQMIDETQPTWSQALTEVSDSSQILGKDLVRDVRFNVQTEAVKEPVSGAFASDEISGEIPVEMTGQTEGLEGQNAQMDSGAAGMSSTDTGAETAGQGVSKKDETDVANVRVEAAVSRTDLSSVHNQGNFVETIEAEVQVTDTGEIRQEYADMIKDMIARQIANGRQELEISLTPRNLGELLVKVAYGAGETTVSIICNNAKAMQAMSSRASELGKMLETTLGDKMDVVVEQKEQSGSHLYEDGRNDGGAQAQKEELERREAELRKRLEKESSSSGFLQQLRLGLK